MNTKYRILNKCKQQEYYAMYRSVKTIEKSSIHFTGGPCNNLRMWKFHNWFLFYFFKLHSPWLQKTRLFSECRKSTRFLGNMFFFYILHKTWFYIRIFFSLIWLGFSWKSLTYQAIKFCRLFRKSTYSSLKMGQAMQNSNRKFKHLRDFFKSFYWERNKNKYQSTPFETWTNAN